MLTREYYTRAHAAGRLRVEGHAHIGLDTPLRVGMCIRHLIHRHEPPVLAGAVQVRCGAFCDLDGEGHACRLSEMMVQHLACLVAVCVGAKQQVFADRIAAKRHPRGGSRLQYAADCM